MCVVVHTHVLTPIFVFALKASVCKLAPVLCEFFSENSVLQRETNEGYNESFSYVLCTECCRMCRVKIPYHS